MLPSRTRAGVLPPSRPSTEGHIHGDRSRLPHFGFSRNYGTQHVAPTLRLQSCSQKQGLHRTSSQMWESRASHVAMTGTAGVNAPTFGENIRRVIQEISRIEIWMDIPIEVVIE